jgi:hypothetical protein
MNNIDNPTMRAVVTGNLSRMNLCERNFRIVRERPAASGMVPYSVTTPIIVVAWITSILAAVCVDIFTN